MKIAIISDTHDHWPNMKHAIATANKLGCEVLLHAGDLIAPPGIQLLQEFKGQVHYVWGNNEGEKVGISEAIAAASNITQHGNEMDQDIGGLHFYMNHYLHISQMAFATGQYDVCIYGHDHQIFEEEKNGRLLLNPGEVCGYRTGNATFMILDTETKRVLHQDINLV